jgi:dTDP-glucose pyrophosphorylase
MDLYTETDCISPRNRSRRPVLRREQREELEINHHQNWTTDEQQEQLEINHHEEWTTDTSRLNGLLYSVRPFVTNSLKEGAMFRV